MITVGVIGVLPLFALPVLRRQEAALGGSPPAQPAKKTPEAKAAVSP
jgi:hypothetical protein